VAIAASRERASNERRHDASSVVDSGSGGGRRLLSLERRIVGKDPPILLVTCFQTGQHSGGTLPFGRRTLRTDEPVACRIETLWRLEYDDDQAKGSRALRRSSLGGSDVARVEHQEIG